MINLFFSRVTVAFLKMNKVMGGSYAVKTMFS